MNIAIVSFLIRNNHRFFLSWLRQLNMFATVQDKESVEYTLYMLYKNQVFNMPLQNQKRVYDKLSFTHHTISQDTVNQAMRNVCKRIGRENYGKVVSAIKNNREASQTGFLNNILFSYMTTPLIKTATQLRVV